ncbi:hypothetical protein NQ318_002827 [Aromia moschata]|uniref:DDE-1 domain-containing protein n=1 Tax=Aromia moschata TaxID=1265417 RepID=A0AAV8XGT9_9CUCU|nr:hypothetical protein NQ318_002827 [Aromia moschata]
MDRNVFTNWYKNVFIPSVKKRNPDPEAKFILILDNAPEHPSSTELNHLLQNAWNSVTIDTLKNSWKNLLQLHLAGPVQTQTLAGLLEVIRRMLRKS